jgi:hypothetical protein
MVMPVVVAFVTALRPAHGAAPAAVEGRGVDLGASRRLGGDEDEDGEAAGPGVADRVLYPGRDEDALLGIELSRLHADTDGSVTLDDKEHFVGDGILAQLELLVCLEADQLGHEPGPVKKRETGGSLRREAPAVGDTKDFHGLTSQPLPALPPPGTGTTANSR